MTAKETVKAFPPAHLTRPCIDLDDFATRTYGEIVRDLVKCDRNMTDLRAWSDGAVMQ